MVLPLVLLCLATVPSFAASTLPARGLFDFDVEKVMQNAVNISTHIWEYGTIIEALIEVQQPELSVFTKSSIPPPTDKYTIPSHVVQIVQKILDAEPANQSTFVINGAAGDPASIGAGVLLANTLYKNETWAADAERELDHLLNDVPRYTNGAISHREEQVQLWADFIYMAPPFIAYFGALEGGENGTALLREAYHQCEAYREVLYDADPGLWEHILLGSFQFTQRWGTGNGWAAMGMLRVLATIQQSAVADELQDEQQNLIEWVDEIVTGAYKFQGLNGTLYNDLDAYSPLTNATFADTAGTASITAAAYRLAAITGDPKHVVSAELAYQLVVASIDADGWVTQAVDPLTFTTPLKPGAHSPEAQSFALLMKAARDAYHNTL